ncbi:MAG: hypothetical protein LLG04_08350 [Parachlamydia sp.]|nr:hypothetical protein [Parachlamydia sp.]
MTITLETKTLVNAARFHDEMIQALQNPVTVRFAKEKKIFKELVHNFIDLKVSKETLVSKMPKSLNSKGQDRIEAKINRFYKKHKPAAQGKPGDKNALETSANSLITTYKELAAANIGTAEMPKTYKDYRNAKKAYKQSAKPVLSGKDKNVVLALKEILNGQKMGAKTVDKLDTFYKKFNKKAETPTVVAPIKKQSNNKCCEAACFVAALAAAIAISVLLSNR